MSPPPNDLVPLVKQALLVELRERPPFTFHITSMVSYVGSGHVYPKADTLGQPLPIRRVSKYARDAAGHEGLDSILFNGRFAVDPKFLFDLHFNRQTVRVPAALA